jgi:predicted PurR-regulated permease PerM
MTGPDTPPPVAGELAAAPLPPRERRPRVKVLLGFLAVFVALLVVFRAVLFPFLMAMFLAYLVEPVVDWVSRRKRLGVQVTRGPAVVLMYLLVLGTLGFLSLLAFRKVDSIVRSAATNLRTELGHTAEKARFVFLEDGRPQPAPVDVEIPAGTLLVYLPPESASSRDREAGTPPPARPRLGVYRTWFAARIEAGDLDEEVLLEATNDPPSRDTPGLVDPARLGLPAGAALAVEPLPRAKGLEVFVERHAIAPIAAQVERVTGEPFDPGFLRRALASESERASAKVASWLVAGGGGLFGGVIHSITSFVLVLMLAAFMIVDRARIASWFASLPPPGLRPQYLRLMEYVDRGLAGVIRGQLIICLVNGVLTWLGLLILGVRYAEVLALVAGVFSLIPVFGTIASSIPIVLVALATGGIEKGLWALAWICMIHLLEANLFNPLIMGTNAEMHPVVIVFALLAGEHAFGLWGALLAVPTASIVQSCFKYYRTEIEGVPPTEPPRHGRWIRDLVSRRKRAQAPATPPGGAP